MKRHLIYFVSVCILLTSAFAMTASATDEVSSNLTDYSTALDDDNERIGYETPASIENFNNYISSLDPEIAELILSDDELVSSMKLNTYWETPTSNDVSALSSTSVTLPLENWPAGSYFSVDRTTPCTCHSSCSYYIPSSSSASQVRCYISATDSSGTCRRYKATGSIQCKGFADYVFHTYTGNDCGASNYDSSKLVSSGLTSAVAKSNFYGISVGSHIRGYLKSGAPHSIIVLSTTSTGITYYQANTNNNCNITTATKSWAEFAAWFDSITGVWVA